MADATVTGADAAALAQRMARHFAHKVPVERVGPAVRVLTRFGSFELEPRGDVLHVSLAADADEEKLRDVVVSHLERFARGEPLTFSWQ